MYILGCIHGQIQLLSVKNEVMTELDKHPQQLYSSLNLNNMHLMWIHEYGLTPRPCWGQ